MDHITVLMSTYNGEKYLQEQLDSILNQKNVEVRLIVRDDGSIDRTREILFDYQKAYPNVHVILDNLKLYACMSFLSLITTISDDDYFALADQDDIWELDKLERAISMLKTIDEDQIALYFSNLKIVDSTGKFYRYSHDTERKLDNKYSSLLDNQMTGCTAVYNRKLAEFVQGKMPERFSMHDTYLFIVAAFFGKTIYDSEAKINYRQHGNNVVGASLKKRGKLSYIPRIAKRIFNRSLQPRHNNAVQFDKLYGEYLNAKDKEKVKELVDYKKNIQSKIRLLTDDEMVSFSRERTLFFRALVLLGNA